MNETPISVEICGRKYQLKVEPEFEPIFREAAAEINQRVKAYSKAYAFKDNQDLLSMVALQYTYNTLKYERTLKFRDDELLQHLELIDKKL